MQYEHQIRTGEFEYIKEMMAGTPEDAVEAHRALKAAWAGGAGIAVGDWNRILDGILAGTGKLAAEEWEQMSTQQKWMLNELKKSKNRKIPKTKVDLTTPNPGKGEAGDWSNQD